jgi:MFS superfamily sulfate permease-like transporter
MAVFDLSIPRHSYIISELAGSAGNFGTVLPLLFAVSVACDMNITLILSWAGVWYILTGLYYRIPIPVEPLKAVGALAIADHLSPHLIAASGILMGIICIGIGFLGWMDRVRRIIPESVIRGVQLGLALIFIRSAVMGFVLPDIFFAGVSAFIVIAFLIGKKYAHIPDLSAFCIIIFGFLVAFYLVGFPSFSFIPIPGFTIPTADEFIMATILLLPPQLPLTLTNAILATSLLVCDLFQKTESPDRLSKTVGVMSLSSSLFGGFPMCHGAGGLAAHYRFGARGGLSLVFGGVLLFLIAGICTDSDIVKALPVGIFGILLIVVATELIRHGLKTNNYLVTIIIAALSVPFGLAAGFFAGLILAWIIQYRNERKIHLI